MSDQQSYTRTVMVGDKEFLAALDRSSKEIFAEVHKEAVGLANQIRKNIITGMRDTPKNIDAAKPRRFQTVNKDTGRRKSIRFGKKAKFHYPSFPGNYPAIDKGELVGSIATDVRDFEIEVGSVGVPHAEYTNEGTKKMAKRPWLEPSYRYMPIEDRLKDAFKRGGGIM